MASALENYVNNVRTLSAAGNYRHLAEHLLESITVELLSKNWVILDDVLETLDVQQHSLGVLFVLISKFNSLPGSNFDDRMMLNMFRNFILNCDADQVRYASHAYYDLCHMFTNFIVSKPYVIMGIRLLEQAINKIRVSDRQLTSIHADLCQLSLKAMNFRIAIDFLNQDLVSIFFATEQRIPNTTDVNNDAKYFLLYYYYGGMIYTALKKYHRAIYFFEVCVSTPAMTMSYVMLEAYKKLLIISLILHGKVMPLPKYSSQVVARFMKPMTQVYHELANAYTTSSNEELRAIINKYLEVFARDHNVGLVKLVEISLYKKNIKRLTKTFLTLSLSDVASRVQLPSAFEAEKYILNMIKSQEIFATINQKDGMVIFKDDPENYNTTDMFLYIQHSMYNVTDLVKQINDMDEEIKLNPVYVKKTSSSQEEDMTSQSAKSFSGCV